MKKILIFSLILMAIVSVLGVLFSFIYLDFYSFALPGGTIGVIVDVFFIAELACVLGLVSYLLLDKNKWLSYAGITVSLLWFFTMILFELFYFYEIFDVQFPWFLPMVMLPILIQSAILSRYVVGRDEWKVLGKKYGLSLLSILVFAFLLFFYNYNLIISMIGILIVHLFLFFAIEAKELIPRIFKYIGAISVFSIIGVRYYLYYLTQADVEGMSIGQLTGYYFEDTLFYDELTFVLLVPVVLATILFPMFRERRLESGN